jgi:hypothetical protein
MFVWLKQQPDNSSKIIDTPLFFGSHVCIIDQLKKVLLITGMTNC